MKIVSPGTEGLAFAIPVETVEFFLRNRDAFAYDASNSNNGFHYLKPPAP
jgi:serine protease Do